MDNFSFARRTNWSQKPNALNKTLEELRSQAVAVADLTASNPTECGFAYPKEILPALSLKQNLQYRPQARGLEEARQAVSSYHAARQAAHLPRENIILTASTSEAYSFLMRLLVDPGEKVLIPRPSYPLFQFLLEINDVE